MTKVLQIGIGGWGHNHARILKHIGVLCGVCDINIQRHAFNGVFDDVPWFNNLDDVTVNFDTVVICTPAATHYKIALEMIKKGKNVFVEKPFTVSSESARELVRQVAIKSETILTCGFIERFNPAIKDIKKPKTLKLYRGGFQPSHIKDTGILYDTSIHDIDLANYLFKSNPIEIKASVRPKFARIKLMYSGGREAEIISRWGVKRRREIIADGVYHNMINDYNKLQAELENFLDAIKGSAELIVKPRQAVESVVIVEKIQALMEQKRLDFNAYQRKKYSENPQPFIDRAMEWNKKNKERKNSNQRKYVANNKDEINARRRTQRASK